MNRRRTAAVLSIVVLLSVIAYAASQLVGAGQQQRLYTISVIVEDSSSNRWRSFREGLSQGAMEGNVVVNVVSTSGFEKISDLTDIIRREQTGGSDGMIVYAGMDDVSGTLSGMLTSIPSVLVGSGLSGQELIDVVEPDGYLLGSTIASLVFENEVIDEEVDIGILSGNQRMPMMQNCLEGFMDSLGDSAGQVQWTLSEQVLQSGNLLGMSMEAKTPDILVALDNEAMETAADFLTANPKYRCRLYGEGRSEQCIYYLDQGVIGALAVPDEFMMGYQSISLLMQKMSVYSPAVRSSEIQILSVTRENLFDDDTAGILFPAVS